MQKKVDVQPGLKPVDFRLEPGKALRVHIVDGVGKPVAGVHVSIQRWRDGESLYNAAIRAFSTRRFPTRPTNLVVIGGCGLRAIP